MFWVAVIAALLLFYNWINALLLVYGAPLRYPRGRIIDRSDIPSDLLELFDDRTMALLQLGFRFSHALEANDVDARSGTPLYELVFYHPERLCIAEVATSELPDFLTPVNSVFRSVFTSGKTLITSNFHVGLDLPVTPDRFVVDTAAADYPAQFEAHLAARDALGEPTSFRPVLMSAEQHLARVLTDHREALNQLLETGAASVKKGVIRLSLGKSVQLLRDMVKAIKRRKKAQGRLVKRQGTDDLPDISAMEQYAYDKNAEVLANHRLGTMLKFFLFLASVAAFGLFFGLFTSFWIVPVLFAVLLFHELGHLLAMKVFGYKDLQVLFLPIGAAALGKNHQASGLQRSLVYLAGPVPGMLLAWLLVSTGIASATGESGIADLAASPWVFELVVMLLLINYINLLPVMPLDGGQIVNLVLFERSPRAHLVFLVVSTVVFGAGAWYLDSDPLLFFLAIATGFMAFAQYNQLTLARRIQDQKGSEPLTSRSIFQAMHHADYARMNFSERTALAKTALTEYAMPPVKLPHKLIGGAMYLAVLLLPLGMAYQAYQSLFDPVDWEAELATATGAERNDLLIRAGQSLLYTGEEAQGRQYLDEALAAQTPPLTLEQRREVFGSLIVRVADERGDDLVSEDLEPWLSRLRADGNSQELTNTYLTLAAVYSAGREEAMRYARSALTSAENLGDRGSMLFAHLAVAQHAAYQSDFATADLALDEAWEMRGLEDGAYLYAFSGAIADRYTLSGTTLDALPQLDRLREEMLLADMWFDEDYGLWICLLGEDFDCASQRLDTLNEDLEKSWDAAWSERPTEIDDSEWDLIRNDHFKRLDLARAVYQALTLSEQEAAKAWAVFTETHVTDWYNGEYFEEQAGPSFEGQKAELIARQFRRFEKQN